jgi:hypothetical protein
MNLQERKASLVWLGDRLKQDDEYLQAVMHRTYYNNLWFTKENQERAIRAIANEFLQKQKLEEWAAGYLVQDQPAMKSVGLIMAGNIPLVGFHDLLCVFVAGHRAKIKLSDKDKFLLPYLLSLLEKHDPRTAAYFEVVELMKEADAVIATGSNNSARYFEAYFGKYPHIIRKNRNSIAVLDGAESDDELMALGKDIFRYFGLGCRNVSKIYVPAGYNFQHLLEVLHEYRDIILHDKYKNNFDYNLAILMMNRTPHLNNGCIILVENPSLLSRIAMLHYGFYQNKSNLVRELNARAEEIQCVVAKNNWLDISAVSFGKTQHPALSDYADGVDVMSFLLTV